MDLPAEWKRVSRFLRNARRSSHTALSHLQHGGWCLALLQWTLRSARWTDGWRLPAWDPDPTELATRTKGRELPSRRRHVYHIDHLKDVNKVL
jgi:hypothetical protein